MNLKKIRKELKKTQLEVATAIGISQQNYCRYETGQYEPDISTLIKLADYFHTTVDYLLGHDVPYLINKSQFSKNQLTLIDKITKLDNEQCLKINSYIDGLNDGKN